MFKSKKNLKRSYNNTEYIPKKVENEEIKKTYSMENKLTEVKTSNLNKDDVKTENTDKKPENNVENNVENTITSFDELINKETLLRGIYGTGFEKPSLIQIRTIPIIQKRKDLIAQSQSGTGKTGAFTIGLLSIIKEENKYPQGVILCNTHELADQIYSVVSDISKYMDIQICLAIGGTYITKNMKEASESHIIVGTPGRLLNLIENQAFDINKVEILIIDEVDEMLESDFFEKTKNIISQFSKTTQVCIFSATIPEVTLNLTKRFMTDPESILIEKERLSLSLITQYYINVEEEKNKFITLDDLYNKLTISQCIIYVNSVNRADILKNKLINNKHNVEVIHGKLDNKERINIMSRFRRSEFRVLISTDLICRGIDVQQVCYVINYDMPYNENSYLHRIGRSGRFGKRGIAINLITDKDQYILKNIEKYYKIKITEMPDPGMLNQYITEI